LKVCTFQPAVVGNQNVNRDLTLRDYYITKAKKNSSKIVKTTHPFAIMVAASQITLVKV
jgi:hypothetical protein